MAVTVPMTGGRRAAARLCRAAAPAAEWAAAGLELPDLQEMRRYRWRRLVEAVVARDYAGLLVTDPMNIRYATDSTNMQLWNTHNPFRAPGRTRG